VRPGKILIQGLIMMMIIGEGLFLDLKGKLSKWIWTKLDQKLVTFHFETSLPKYNYFPQFFFIFT